MLVNDYIIAYSVLFVNKNRFLDKMGLKNKISINTPSRAVARGIPFL